MIDTLISLAERADESTILKSRKHCHAKHVSSIVLEEEDGQLFRAFLAWPGHCLDTNSPGGNLTVGIHDHRYDITLSLIHGDVTNVAYSRDPGEGCHWLTKWLFQSGVKNGTPKFEQVGGDYIRETSRETLRAGDWLLLHADTLHGIECSGACAWFVSEGAEKKTETTLYTNGQIDASGLYESFGSRDDVVSHVREWARLAVAQDRLTGFMTPEEARTLEGESDDNGVEV